MCVCVIGAGAAPELRTAAATRKVERGSESPRRRAEDRWDEVGPLPGTQAGDQATGPQSSQWKRFIAGQWLPISVTIVDDVVRPRELAAASRLMNCE